MFRGGLVHLSYRSFYLNIFIIIEMVSRSCRFFFCLQEIYLLIDIFCGKFLFFISFSLCLSSLVIVSDMNYGFWDRRKNIGGSESNNRIQI